MNKIFADVRSPDHYGRLNVENGEDVTPIIITVSVIIIIVVIVVSVIIAKTISNKNGKKHS